MVGMEGSSGLRMRTDSQGGMGRLGEKGEWPYKPHD